MNRDKKILFAAALAIGVVGSADAATYTWLGTAGDGDWENVANWDANGVPVDAKPSASGLSLLTASDDLIIQGTAPTLNIPTFSGGDAFDRNNDNTPQIQMLLGTMSVDVETWRGRGLVHNGFWSSSVGDGDTGNGLAVLNYNLIQGTSQGLNRDDGSNMAWTINTDGTLNISTTTSTLQMAFNSGRTVGFNLAGGTLNIDSALDLGGFAGNFFDFTDIGASVTANFGGDFADLASVNADLGGTHFISTTSLLLTAVDNGDGTYTVSSIVPEPSSLALGLVGLAGLIARRRRD